MLASFWHIKIHPRLLNEDMGSDKPMDLHTNKLLYAYSTHTKV